YTVIKNDRSSFAETVLIPANIFQCDTDTTACVAGAAKGLILGLAGIEKTLVSTLQDTEYIKLCAQALYNGSGHHAFQPSLTDKPLEYYRKNLTEINHGEVLKTRLFGSAVIVEKNMNETLLTARIKTQNPEFTLIIKKIPK
ncbi:MAG TPA: ADP-ribosylglycohydrolase family protein, partial [Petrotogaceae bacterium]|nr:ADP-ribosylglycohydrolase family protein [Petrotogaceae bacterium]